MLLIILLLIAVYLGLITIIFSRYRFYQ